MRSVGDYLRGGGKSEASSLYLQFADLLIAESGIHFVIDSDRDFQRFQWTFEQTRKHPNSLKFIVAVQYSFQLIIQTMFVDECLGQYGQAYGYQTPQQNVPLPGQLQPSSQVLQPSLPGQSAQLHVTHITPPGGVQTVHQTQVPNFSQSGAGGQQIQSTNREYLVQGPGGMSSQSMHQNMHQSPVTNQVISREFCTLKICF